MPYEPSKHNKELARTFLKVDPKSTDTLEVHMVKILAEFADWLEANEGH